MGFFCEVEERDDDEESECLEIRDGALEEGVFTVERVVERRRRKVSVQFTVAAVKYYIVACVLFIIQKGECLVLWAGYRREEASWVADEDVTAAALR